MFLHNMDNKNHLFNILYLNSIITTMYTYLCIYSMCFQVPILHGNLRDGWCFWEKCHQLYTYVALYWEKHENVKFSSFLVRSQFKPWCLFYFQQVFDQNTYSNRYTLTNFQVANCILLALCNFSISPTIFSMCNEKPRKITEKR